MKSLTLEQKCALLSGADVFKTRAFPAAGLPALWLSDGPHGVRKQAGASDHLGLNPSEPATCFPTAVTVAQSWDTHLAEEIGQALGREAAAQGVGVLLGPGLNIKRNPLCGRNFEYFSEDPYLAGKLAAGYVRGIQSQGISACPKHFAANNQELRRMASDSVLDERTLREIYLTGFEIALQEGEAKTLMTSYNLINGEYANENKHLLVDILRGEWGYKGMVVTDWGGSNDHVQGVKCTSSLEMPAPGLDSARQLLAAVREGRLSEEEIDARVEEVLRVALDSQAALEKADKTIDWEGHHALARKAAAESVVLLKNEGDLLPLAAGTRVAVIGNFAATARYQGAGSSVVNNPRLDNFLEMARQTMDVVGYAQGFDRFGRPDQGMLEQAVELARQADAVLLCLGLDEIKESEGLDRADMKLADNQIRLLEAVAAVNPRVAVLLFAGSAVELPWLDKARALVYAALGGQAGAGALADVITGKVNPSGKLAETWPLAYEDAPSAAWFGGDQRQVEYREGLYVGYRYYQTAGVPVAFPFGYGLSYTSFGYSDIQADEKRVSFTLTNTGSRPGAEVVQLYVAPPRKEVFGPVQQLKGFARVELQPGESRRVEIPLDDKAFRYWNVDTDRWEIEPGTYQLRLGASCEDIRLSADIVLAGSGAAAPYKGLDLPHYRSGQVQGMAAEEFDALRGDTRREGKPAIDRNITFGELGHGRSPLGWLVGAVLNAKLRRSLRSGKPDLNILFIYNMPLRAVAKMTNGMVSMGVVEGLVMELKGFWVLGLLRALGAFVVNLLRNRSMEKRLR